MPTHTWTYKCIKTEMNKTPPSQECCPSSDRPQLCPPFLHLAQGMLPETSIFNLDTFYLVPDTRQNFHQRSVNIHIAGCRLSFCQLHKPAWSLLASSVLCPSLPHSKQNTCFILWTLFPPSDCFILIFLLWSVLVTPSTTSGYLRHMHTMAQLVTGVPLLYPVLRKAGNYPVPFPNDYKIQPVVSPSLSSKN